MDKAVLIVIIMVISYLIYTKYMKYDVQSGQLSENFQYYNGDVGERGRYYGSRWHGKYRYFMPYRAENI